MKKNANVQWHAKFRLVDIRTHIYTKVHMYDTKVSLNFRQIVGQLE